AFLHIKGQKQSVLFRTRDVRSAFGSEALDLHSMQHLRKKAFEEHDYYFLPSFDPAEEMRKIRRVLSLMQEQAVMAALAAEESLLLLPGGTTPDVIVSGQEQVPEEIEENPIG